LVPVYVQQFPLPPTLTPTATPSGSVSLESIWLEGPRGRTNYDFRRCEVVYQLVQITNYSATPLPVTVDWVVRDSAGKLVPALSYTGWQVSWPTGTYNANLARALPANMPLGPYSVTIQMRGPAGVTAQRMAYFNVSDDDSPGLPLAELVLCRDVLHGLPTGLDNSVFSVEDKAIYAWTWWQRAGGVPHKITWIWYGPDGAEHASYSRDFTESCTFYAWAWMEIADSEVAGLPGTWKLEVWRDGLLVTTRSFQIVAETDEAGGTGQAATGGGHLAAACGALGCGPQTPR